MHWEYNAPVGILPPDRPPRRLITIVFSNTDIHRLLALQVAGHIHLQPEDASHCGVRDPFNIQNLNEHKLIVMQLVSKLPTFHELLVCYYNHNNLPVDPAPSHILHIPLSAVLVLQSPKKKSSVRGSLLTKSTHTADKASLHNIILTRLPQCQGYCIVKLDTSLAVVTTQNGLYRAACKNHRM
jgi:hypothetical protein